MGDLASELVVVEDEDQFYEEIQAPKFVDFRVPDRSRPDDKSWFCVRIGCDQKHEDVDPDALQKSFVLRVMAARSPNLRLRKALSGQPASAIAKCPRSAPAKSAKDRLQIPGKISNTRLRDHPISNLSSTPNHAKAKEKYSKDRLQIPGKTCNTRLRDHPISNLSSTPNHAKTKEKYSIAEKALTTPRNKRLLPKGEPLRSVQNPKVHVPVLKNKKVAKTLVFNTPKKDGKTATLNCLIPISEMCARVNELDIGNHKKHVSGHLFRPLRSARHDPSYSKPASVHAKSRTNESKSRCEEGSVNLKKSDYPMTKEGGHDDVSDLRTDGSLPSLVEPPVEGNVQSEVADGTSYDNTSDRPKFDEKDLDEKISSHTSGRLKDEKKVKDNSSDTDENFQSVVADSTSNDNPSDQTKFEKDSDEKNSSHTSDRLKDEKRAKDNSSDTDENLQSVVADSTSNDNPSEQTKFEEKDSDEKNSIHTSDRLQDELKVKDHSSDTGENFQSVVVDSTSYDKPSDRTKFEEDSDEKISSHTSNRLQDEKTAKDNSPDTDENKENASATWETRETTSTIINPETENIQHEISKYPSKTVGITTKACKDHLVQGGRCKRMKPTNPKPFRLRTDERGILKEANLERRMQIGAQRETVPVTRRHDEVQGRVILARIKSARCAEPKIVTDTPRRQMLENGKVKVTQKVKNRSPKLAMLRKLIKRQSMTAERKKGTCKSTSRPKEGATNESQSDNTTRRMIPQSMTAEREKGTCRSISRPKERATHESQSDNTTSRIIIPSLHKRTTTVPKEPNFHRIRIPKSCTKRSVEVC